MLSAKRAEGVKMIFYDEMHKTRFITLSKKIKILDVYHKSLIYLIALNVDCYRNIDDIYDIKNDVIKKTGIKKNWQTSTSKRVTRLAFNLWNNTIEKANAEEYTPCNIFCDPNAEYYMQAIKIRFPEMFNKNPAI